MEFFKWDQHFPTGLEWVDEQHRRLVALLNELIGLLVGPRTAPKPELARVFAELADFAGVHFSEEETLMSESGVDPRHLNHHRQVHLSYIEELARKQKAILECPELGGSLVTFLGQWLAHHILGCDQSMARQIDAIRAGIAPAEAYERESLAHDEASEPLLHALSAMFEQLIERNRSLVQANETLEGRIAERTDALRKANAELSELVRRREAEKAESQRLSFELAEANEHLLSIAQTDVLTGLPNRRYAMNRLERIWSEAVRHASSLSCILIDVDDFKRINDSYGHDGGDRVLRELAMTLRAFSRKEDEVCRLGGDEFLILCPRLALDNALKLAENLRERVNALRIEVGEGEWAGSLSFGVAEREEGSAKPDELIKSADQGLYLAKQRGRNQVATISHAQSVTVPHAQSVTVPHAKA